MRKALDMKQRLRTALSAKRDALALADRVRIDRTITDRVLRLPEVAACRTLLCYCSFQSEVDTHVLIEALAEWGVSVALPRCGVDGEGARTLWWHTVDSFAGLEPGPFGIMEPPEVPATRMDPAVGDGLVAIVPGLAFDAAGFRLGYGGGYYDRFLAGFRGCAIGLCRAEALVASLAREGALESHDRPVDIVVTERGVLRRS